jgi:hypothetical protein
MDKLKKEFSMKNFTKLVGIIAFVAVIIFSMVGCEMFKEDEFPSEFRGTWVRDFQSSYTNTLTFTSDTLKDSTQSYQWELLRVSGDDYTIKTGSTERTITIKFSNGNLVFSGDSAIGEHDWDGRWRKQ